MLGVAVLATALITAAPDTAQAADGTPTPVVGPPGVIVRVVGNGTVTASDSTAVATYVIVGPGGIIYGADGTPIAETPVSFVSGGIGSPPVQVIGTPTQVVAPRVGLATATGVGAARPGQYFIGALDGPTYNTGGLPPPVTSSNLAGGAGIAPAQTISTPTPVVARPPSAVVGGVAAPVAVAATPTAGNIVGVLPTAPVGGNDANVIVGTPAGGVSGMGVVNSPGRIAGGR